MLCSQRQKSRIRHYNLTQLFWGENGLVGFRPGGIVHFTPDARLAGQDAGGSRRVLLALHKPFDVLSQFTQELEGQRTLADFGLPAGVYPIGRLDRDSEGLLLLSDEKALVDRLLHPRHQHKRRYFSQVEGLATTEALQRIARGGLEIQGHRTLPCRTRLLAIDPDLPPRNPPIRYRANIPTSWIELELHEGKNRQVRRMTAAVGFPTLRLVRIAIGGFELGTLAPGEWRELTPKERELIFAQPKR